MLTLETGSENIAKLSSRPIRSLSATLDMPSYCCLKFSVGFKITLGPVTMKVFATELVECLV